MPRRDPLAEPLEVSQFVTEVGLRIRLMRRARKLSQADLAARADISRLTPDIARLLWALDDSSLQVALADAARDSIYQEAARTSLPRSRRRGGDAA